MRNPPRTRTSHLALDNMRHQGTLELLTMVASQLPAELATMRPLVITRTATQLRAMLDVIGDHQKRLTRQPGAPPSLAAPKAERR